MAQRRVQVVFSAEIAGFRRAMDEAAAATRRTGQAAQQASQASTTHLGSMVQSATQNRDAWETAGATMLGFGTAAVAGVGLAVKSYADFDKQMSSVKAATHETAENMDLLKQAAVSAGAETSFSAVEAAKGIEELAKAGVSTAEILNGGLDGALSLAAAGALDVGEAAEIAASALTQFKLDGADIPHVADLLAAGAGKAQGSVQDMGAALNQVGLVAAQTGLSIEETTGGLAAFASAGLVGSDAGTSFKSMLAALTPNSDAAAKAMEDLGISAYDSQGNFVGLSEYAGQLKASLSGLTDEQRNSTLETIFGSDAVRAAAVLYEQGADGVQKWEDAVNDAGYAAETAALMQDNLAGDLEKLGGAFDTVLLQSGSGANEVLRGFVQGLEDVIDAVGKVPAPVLSAGAGILGVVGVAALGVGAFLSLTPKVLDAVQAFNKLAPAGGRARGALVSVGKAAGGAMAIGALTLVVAKLAESSYMDDIDTGMGRVAKALAEVTTNSPDATAALDSLFKDRTGGNLIHGVEDLNTAMQRTFNKNSTQDFNDWAEGLVNGVTGVKGSSQILSDSFGRIDDSLASLVSSGKADEAATAFKKIEDAAKIQGATVEELAEKFPAYNDALDAADAAAKTASKSTDGAATAIQGAGAAAAEAVPSAEDIAEALEDLGLKADGTVKDLGKFTEALMAAGLIQMSAREATAAHQAAIDGTKDAVKEATKAIEDQLVAEGYGAEAAKALATEQYNLGAALNKSKTDFDLTSEAGRILNSQFQSVASTGMAEIEAKAKAGVGQPELQKNLKTTYDSLITALAGMGITGGGADTLARKVMGIPKKANINTWMDTRAKQMAEETKGAIDRIPKQVNITFNTHRTETTLQKVIRQVSNAPATGEGTVLLPRKKATGGILRGYSEGGQLPSTGPGTEVTDGFLGIDSAGRPVARLDANEWVINGMSSERYNRELAAINAGTFPKLPGFASGGREYSAQQLGYSPSTAGGGVSVAAPNVTVMIGNEQLDSRMYRVASSAVSSADNQSKFMRKGR